MASQKQGMAADAVTPPIPDGSGYHARHRDLTFLNISLASVQLRETKSCPLGMTPTQYSGFVDSLRKALKKDGIAPNECDVRLKGSSAAFYSGYHKPMVTQSSILPTYRKTRKRLPPDWLLKDIWEKLNGWIADGDFPHRCPFDSMHRLGIDNKPSDYDLQISSSVLVERCIFELRARGDRPSKLKVRSKEYAFVQKDLVEEAAPNLYIFSLRMTEALLRDVSIAIFDSSGPPDVSKKHGNLSSHFQKNDWIIDL